MCEPTEVSKIEVEASYPPQNHEHLLKLVATNQEIIIISEVSPTARGVIGLSSPSGTSQPS
jgi:hypothetical protein